ncbi:gametocyte-specific factor 1-like, partial [Daphnia carinata]
MNRVTCPFDPAHVVEARKLQAHLIKCKRNLPTNHDFVQCDFWHLHYVRKSQLDSHVANCEHRLEKEAFKITWESEASKFSQPKLLPVEVCEPSEIEDQESWESTSGPA